MATVGDFHRLRIASAEHVAGDALVLTFDVPAALAATFAFKPGQHVAVRALVGGEELRRTYSICSGPADPMRVAIKRVTGGTFSAWAHATLAAGMSIDVMPPLGRFVLATGIGATSSPRRIVLFAAGSGITPCLGITRQALEHQPATHVTLVYGNRGRDTTMFSAELEALKDRHLDRFELIHVLSRDGEADVDLFGGRITGDKVLALGRRLIDYAAAERIFVCGPGSMIKDVRDALLAAGVARDTVQHEFFAPMRGAARVLPTPAPAAMIGIDAVAILDDVRHRMTVLPGETLLAAALRSGLKAPYSCSGGMCATCRAKVIEGQAEMLLNYSLEAWEMERGFVLTCQAVPKSSKIVVDWDAM